MKSFTTYITEKMVYTKANKPVYKYHPKTKEELREIIKECIKNEGSECDLNDIDVSEITDMSHLFYYSKFNGDISNWDVSNVTTMDWMFANSNFNGDISKWKLNNNCKTKDMFNNCPLKNQPEKWPQNYKRN